MKITEDLLTVNEMSRSGDKLESVSKIVIHYVANPGSNAKANRDYFESLKYQDKISASTHYIIDLNGEILRIIPEDEIAYHSGNKELNRNSIGIEFTHLDSTGKPTLATYNALVELLSYLTLKYDLDLFTDIIRHYDVNKKICPKYYVYNIEEYERLKEDVSKFSMI